MRQQVHLGSEMDFLNHTCFPALHYEAADQHGAVFHVIVVRQSFRITPSGLVLDDSQEPVRDMDEYFDHKLQQSVRQESDLCPFKPKSDVIVNAVAYAPNRTPSRQFEVRLIVDSPDGAGNTVDSRWLADAASGVSRRARNTSPKPGRVIDKALMVTGERRIVKRFLPIRMCARLLGAVTFGLMRVPPWRLTRPALCMSLPMRYDVAYGGENLIEADPRDRSKQVRKIGEKFCLTPEQAAQHPMAADDAEAPVAHVALDANPVGVGFAVRWYLKNSGIRSLPAPRVEYPNQPFSAKAFWKAACGKATLQPAGLGAVGRAWLPRRALIGEIDASSRWSEDEFPSLPPEFDHGYWNCAPVDQQCPHLRGDEFITLINLAAPNCAGSETIPSGDTMLRFQLSGARLFLAIADIDERLGVKTCVLDTVYVDPEVGSVELIWRATVPAEVCPGAMQLRVADSEPARELLETFLRASPRDVGADLQPAMRG